MDSRNLRVPSHLRNTRRFLKSGFRVGLAGHETGHWYGGPPRHRGADCFTCGAKLRLIWDINLQDERLPVSYREAFPNLSRLPLYYCFNCPQATTYHVQTDDTVICLDPAGHDGGDETPYADGADVPEHLPRSAIQLDEIPPTIDDIINKESESGFDSLDSAEQDQLGTFLSKKVDSPWDLVFSQFGGLPVMVQGHWDIRCPKADCPAAN